MNNPEDIDTIGASIQLNGNAQAINSMITYLSPAGLNGEGTALNGEMVKTTRELAGASENILGQIDPTRVAASAIAALQEQSASILNEQAAKFEKYVEDTARLWWELDIVYNDTVETQDSDGNRIKVTPDEMSELQPEVRVDVSQDTAFTKESALVRIDKLLEMQQITVEEWAKLLPQNSPLPKDEYSFRSSEEAVCHGNAEWMHQELFRVHRRKQKFGLCRLLRSHPGGLHPGQSFPQTIQVFSLCFG